MCAPETYDTEVELRVHNLYLDMDDILHLCCTQQEEGPQQLNTEEIFTNMWAMIDQGVLAFCPYALLYIALEGMAPQAKTKQQST
jgi:5'-3' exoribonuclease 2